MRHYKVNIFLQWEHKGGATQATLTDAEVTATSMVSAASKAFRSMNLEDFRQHEGAAVRIEVNTGPVLAKKGT